MAVFDSDRNLIWNEHRVDDETFEEAMSKVKDVHSTGENKEEEDIELEDGTKF